MKHGVRRVVATGVAAAAIAVVGGHTAASASTQYAPDTFHICVDQACTMETNGTINWSARSATIQGEVINRVTGPSTATAHFGVFAGQTSVDGMFIKAVVPAGQTADAKSVFPAIALGDPNLVGGVNIVEIKICSSTTRCSAVRSYYRN